MKPAHILTPAERAQSGWAKVEEALTARLARHRALLEAPSTPAAEREHLVHRIAELKDTLRLAVPDAKKD